MVVINVKAAPYNAAGDGVTNDTAAFQAACAALEAQDGGVLLVPPGTYVWGIQDGPPGVNNAGYAYRMQEFIDIRDCTKPVKLILGGVTFVLQNTATPFRYGAFDPVTGAALPDEASQNANYRADVGDAIYLQSNKLVSIVGPVEINGNVQNLVVGGPWGTDGRQIRGSGLQLVGNERVYVENVYTHHNALDGVRLSFPKTSEFEPVRWNPNYPYINVGSGLNTNYATVVPTTPPGDPTKAFVYRAVQIAAAPNDTSGATEPTWPQLQGQTVVDGGITWKCDGPDPMEAFSHSFVNLTCQYNGRQGLTWAGGNGLYLANCSFDYTGRGDSWGGTSPRAGFDLEPTVNYNRNGTFVNVSAIGNKGAAVISDANNRSSDITFVGGRLWGNADAYTVWIKNPRFRFIGTQIFGPVVNTYVTTNPEDVTVWENCYFEDVADPTYGVRVATNGLLDALNVDEGPVLRRCTFVTNSQRALTINTTGSPSVYRAAVEDCNIVVKYPGATNFLHAVLAGVRISNTRFMERQGGGTNGTGQRISVDLADIDVGENVVVDGPNIKWNNNTTGTIQRNRPISTSSSLAAGSDLQFLSASVQSFTLRITTDPNGAIAHDFRMQSGSGLDGTAATLIQKITGASATLTPSPLVTSSVGFANGGGIQGASAAHFIFNTAAQVAASVAGLAVVAVDTTGNTFPITAELETTNVNVAGVTRVRLGLYFRNGETGQDFALTNTNIPAGKAIWVRVFAFIR